MKKIKYIILWVFIGFYAFAVLGFVAERQQRLVCNAVEVRVVDSLRNTFVFANSIRYFLQQNKVNLIGKNFKDIDLKKIETLITSYAPVEKAEVYKTIEGKVIIEVVQRNPLIRIIDSDNLSYYIDDKGYFMRLSANYTSNVIIANGHIRTGYPVNNKINVLALEAKAQGKRIILADLYKLAKFILNDKFWNAQIQQIYVDASGDFELIPRVGSHVIIFGDYTDCEDKFHNLMSLYKHGLSVTGWNNYETINLKYKGQVVCSRRE